MSLIDTKIVEEAKLAQAAWAKVTVRERLLVLRQLRRNLVTFQKELGDAVKADIDKPRVEALSAEILPLADAIKFLEKRAEGLLKPRRISLIDRPLWLFGSVDKVLRQPRGVVGIIGTWNYPIMLNGVQIVQALTAGNAVIWKPSEVAPTVAKVMERWLSSATLPAKLVQVLPATREYGPAMAEADVDHIVFTGHDSTGRKLAARLGERLISSTLELSGHDAMLVMPDADLKLAASAAWFGLNLNAGQTCIATRRLFVPASKLVEFEQALVRRAAEQPVTPRKLAQNSAVGHAEKLEQEAIQQGARYVIAPTNSSQENFSPVVLTAVRPDMEIAKAALFVPVMLILPYDDATLEKDQGKHLLEQVNQCDYCLGLSLFSRNPQHWLDKLPFLPAGGISMNDVIIGTAHPAAPFGGIRSSGWGTTQGAEGLLEMTIPQHISFKKGTWRPHYDTRPNNPFLNEKLLQRMIQWRHSATFVERWKGFWGMLRKR